MGCLEIIDVARRIEHVFSNQKVKTQNVPHFVKKRKKSIIVDVFPKFKKISPIVELCPGSKINTLVLKHIRYFVTRFI